MSRGPWIVAALLLGACRSPKPQDVLVDLRTPVGIVQGLSTETGILVLSEAVPEQPDFYGESDQPRSTTLDPRKASALRDEYGFRYHVGNGMFDDVAVLRARGEQVSILEAVSSRPNQTRIGTRPASPDDRLYLEIRNTNAKSILTPVNLYERGTQGDLLVPSSGGAVEDLAQKYAGVGLFAYRDNYLQLVGIMNGVYAPDTGALAFIGIDEIARMLPQVFSYVERKTYPYRADFEYGVPRDFAGERVGSSGAGEVPPYDPTESSAAPVPFTTGPLDGAATSTPDGDQNRP